MSRLHRLSLILATVVLFISVLRWNNSPSHQAVPPPAPAPDPAGLASTTPQPADRPEPLPPPPVDDLIDMPSLPASREQQWLVPSPLKPMAAFQTWTSDHAADPQSVTVAEGLRLAAERRALLRDLIERDPQQALANAVPESVRRQVPQEVRSLLEDTIDARGDLIVTGVTYDDDRPDNARAVRTEAWLSDGRQLDAFVFGNREFKPSRENLPIHGIAIDGALAIDQWPGRVLDPLEAADAKLALTEPDPACETSGRKVSSTGTEVALQRGEDTSFFCGPAHARDVLAGEAASEALRPPGLGARFRTRIDSASGGAGTAVPSFLAEGDSDWTTGSKRILAVRVRFEGLGDSHVDYSDLTQQNCVDIIAGLRSIYADWSYGRLDIRPVATGGSRVGPTINLSRGAADYDGDEVSEIWTEVMLQLSYKHGIDLDDYDILLVLAGDAPLTDEDDDDDVVTWGGMGRIGDGLSFIRKNDPDWSDQKRVDENIRVSLHEIGHNLGLFHSSNTFSAPQITSKGLLIGKEYGDIYDNMGRSGFQSDYNVRLKKWLNWLDPGNVPGAATDGVYTIREHDLEEKSGLRGLQVSPEVPFNPFAGASQLFVEYRLHPVVPVTGFPYIPYQSPHNAWGAQIRLGKVGSPKTWLLDATPETPNWDPVDPATNKPDESGNFDSPLLPGRTFAFSRNGRSVYITNLGADPEAGELRIEVQHGPVAGNDPPFGSILPSTPQGARNQTILFTANVSDPEDSDLAYHWQIPEFDFDAYNPAVFPNTRTIAVAFPSLGTMTVKCLVSDKHGGTVQLTRDFNVVANQPPTISAISSRSTNEDTAISGIPFTVSDATTPAASLTVTVQSENTALFPAGSLVLGGSGGNRTLSLTPAPNRHGESKITLRVNDGALTSVTTFTVTVNPVTPGTTLIASRGTWRYYDNAAAPPATWKESGFDDSAWPSDGARFVYPTPLLMVTGWTVLAAPASSRMTTYFRRTFTLPSGTTGSPMLRFLCDDGMVAYLNGTEIWRHNMPDGPVGHTTRALSSVGGSLQGEWITVPISPTRLRTGTHTLAVEVHDVGGTRGSGDVTFDLEFALLQAPTVSAISDKFSPEDTPAGPYSFTASEAESPSGGLTFTASSSNQAVVLDSSIKFGFNLLTQSRTVTCTPEPNATGTTEITVKASDGSSQTWESFLLVITPVNDPPQIEPLPDLAAALGELPPLVEVVLSDVDSAPASLVVTATSNNAAFLPASAIQVLDGPTPDRRWLRLSPTPNVAAQATVTVTASDGAASGSDAFIFRVSPPVDITATDITLVRSGESWRYWPSSLPLDPRGNPIDFTAANVDDRPWPSGASPLGYSNPGLKTIIPTQPLRVTTYLRKQFTVPTASAVSELTMRMLRDDGAVVYLNGTLIWTSNMPRGPYSASTLASSDITGFAETTWQTQTVTSTALRSGINTLAVELHQSALPTSLAPGDLGFDFEISGVAAPPVAIDVLIAPGERWSYWDQPTYPDDTWRQPSFAEDGWKQGLARLGYGIGGESTVVNRNNQAGTARNPSVLFRKVFDIADPAAYSALHLFTQHDDGIAIHLNGTRVHARNLPGTAATGDFAIEEITAPAQTTWQHFLLDPKRLIPGRNLIAVSVHQASAAGTDLNFDLQLSGEIGDLPPLFIRPSGNSIELSWPAAYNGWSLHRSGTLGAWQPVGSPPLLDGAWIYVVEPKSGPAHFYRLEKP